MRAVVPVAALFLAALSSAAAAGSPATCDDLLRSDLAPEVLDAVTRGEPEGREPPRALLERILLAATAYHFSAGLVGLDTDRRWYGTLPPDEPAAPLLEVRRWPGDSVLALYALAGPGPPFGLVPPAFPDARLRPVRLFPSELPAVAWVWIGVLEDRQGVRPAIWVERAIPGLSRRLGALLLPGDAGLGGEATACLTQELLAVLDRIRVRTDGWREEPGIPEGVPPVLPELSTPPGPRDENHDVWQIARGKDYSLGLPPGIRARRLDRGYPAPRTVPGGLLWFRGTFTDREGTRVEIGDPQRGGTVCERSPASRAWASGRGMPLGLPEGCSRLAAEPFALATRMTRARSAQVERWKEPGFAGEWLVFRLALPSRGVEIAIPVRAGRRSPSLFWIPLTWREGDEAPAPPPVDPAERFGISFQRYSRLEKRDHPWTEGILTVPGMILEVPRDWYPVASLRSRDGFPVSLVLRDGRVAASIRRFAPGAEIQEEWKPAPDLRISGASRVYRRADGSVLVVGIAGERFILQPTPVGSEQADYWARLLSMGIRLRPKVGKKN